MTTPAPMNVIIITADEMRGDCMGVVGNPDIKTPNLDRLAANSHLLRRHFAVHGKCVPSRISLATGRYCHTDGFRSINEENHLPDGSPDILSALKRCQYESAVFGHNHVWSNFWGTNTARSSIVDYHSFTKPEFAPLLEKKLAIPAAGSVNPDPLPDGYDHQGRQTGELSGFIDGNRTDQAIHFLSTVRDRSRPFFMQVNLGFPHPPYKVHEPFYSMYDRETLTPFPHELPENAPLPLRAMRELRTNPSTNAAHLREIQATYYGQISHVDELVGRLIDQVEHLGLRDNTVIIFTSDHGDFASQYGLIEKWDTAMNDCILNVPCIIHVPGTGKGDHRGLSEHVDLTPTILDALQIPDEHRWPCHGRSLLPMLCGHTAGKHEIFADGGHEADTRARFDRDVYSTDKKTGKQIMTTAGKQRTYHTYPDSMARTKMIRTDTWKYVVRETGGDELYHLPTDPREMHNCITESQHLSVIADLQRRLLNWCLRTDPDRPRLTHVGA